ncbi:hypothetical protein ABEV55_18445 [Aneurinibacillus thermoaerophilus]|uniref:5' nucleotidase, NT5C type n=1 Tax=Aneurinibacillus thermoaerophilus TaxID=143495 RepID=UPI002E2008EB|nr:hypothetical protein [Aneurinibacillus thermoaerophilus]
MRHVILCDLDNTVVNTNPQIGERVLGFTTSVYPFPLPPDFFEKNPDVFRHAHPFPGAAQTLRAWVSTGHSLYYVTARGEWSRQLTSEWLHQHHFPMAPLIFSCEKDVIAHDIKATIAFEDSPGEIDKLSEIIPTIFVHEMTYNRSYKNRFRCWHDIFGKVV